MYPCQDPIINHRILEHHPFPVDISGSRGQKKKTQSSTSISQEKTSNFDVVSKLPSELWAKVFLNCLPEPPPIDVPYPWYNRNKYSSPLTAPLLLCQICRIWREIAVTLPQLWQRLAVYVSMATACPAPGLAELWLARSGSLPLTLSIHQQNEAHLNGLAAARILTVFLQHTSRWKDIDLSLSPSRPILGTLTSSNYHSTSTTDKRIISPAPILERFKLRTPSRVYEREERFIFGVFQDVTRLNALHISRVPELDLLGNSTVSVPWHQLSALTIEYVPSIGTTLHLISKCERLEEGSFKADALFGPLPEESVVHTRLRKLGIDVGNEQCAAFCEGLTLPALESFSVHVRGPLERYGWAQGAFERFLHRSGCRLTHLELQDSGMRLYQFVRTLQQPSLQGLEELVIDDRRDWTCEPFVKDLAFDMLNCTLYPEIYSVLAGLDRGGATTLIGGSTEPDNGLGDDGGSGGELAGNGGRMCFLPKLKGLTLRGNCVDTVDGTIADMVESRFYFRERGVAQLRSLKIDLPTSHFADLQRLRWMQAEGLELEVDFI